MKIVILDGYTENPGDLSWENIQRLGTEFIVYDRTTENDIITRIDDAQIIFTNKTPISKETIEKCKNLKYIGVLATGFNVVDVNAAKEKGILVTNIPTYGTEAVAQFTIALLMEICHNIGHHSNEVKKGRWENNKDWCFWDYPLIELSGKTMGIIGFGRIGRATSKIASAMGMHVVYYDEFADNITEAAKKVSLDELYGMSDVIALHCPLLPSTEKIINKDSISKMKDGVIILNTSRGPLVNEQDLSDALNSGKVYWAAVDVVSQEPIDVENPLLQNKNCFITPHIAWAPKESRKRLMDIATENLEAFLNNNPINVVNL